MHNYKNGCWIHRLLVLQVMHRSTKSKNILRNKLGEEKQLLTMLWLKLRLSLLNFDLIEKQTSAHDWLEISDQWSKMCIHLLLLSLRLILHVLQQSYNRTYIPQTCLQLSKVSLLQRCLVEGEMSPQYRTLEDSCRNIISRLDHNFCSLNKCPKREITN